MFIAHFVKNRPHFAHMKALNESAFQAAMASAGMSHDHGSGDLKRRIVVEEAKRAREEAIHQQEEAKRRRNEECALRRQKEAELVAQQKAERALMKEEESAQRRRERKEAKLQREKCWNVLESLAHLVSLIATWSQHL